MRWLSPPDSVPEPRASVRYSRPTSTRKRSRSRISFSMRTAISFCCLVSLFRDLREPFAGLAHAHLGDLADMQAADLHAQRFGLQAIAVAGVAGNVGEIFLQFLARPVAFGFAEAALQIGDHALERLFGLVGAQAVVIDELDVVIAGAIQDRVLRFLRQRLPFGVERELVMLGRALPASACNRARIDFAQGAIAPLRKRGVAIAGSPDPHRYAARRRGRRISGRRRTDC